MILKHLKETEKTSILGKQRKYVFEVSQDSTKGEIAREVFERYSVKVLKINVLRRLGKVKRAGAHPTLRRTPLKKLAIITLNKDDQIKID